MPSPARPDTPTQPLPPQPEAPTPGAVAEDADPAPAADPRPDQDDEPSDLRIPPPEGWPVIVRIEFEGNLLYGSDMMKTRLLNKEGKRLDPVALDEDMKELYRYFKEIQVVKEQVPGGIVLRFLVSENPLVVRLEIRGAAEMEEDEIRQMLRTQAGFPLSPYHLASDREDVEEAYRLRGFHFVHVPDPRVTVLANGGRHVTFSVVEGPEVQVDSIIFRGNVHLPRKDLVEVMLTEEPNFIEVILGESIFREDVLREDLVAIKQLYRREGFLDAEVALDDLRFSDDKSRVEVAIAIVEHQPYRIGEITFDIERTEPGSAGCPTTQDLDYFSEERLRALIGLKSGEIFSGKAMDKGLEKIKETYYERSYVDAGIGPARLRGREKDLVVDLEVFIREGRKYRLARVDFLGNEFTRDKILRREIKATPGGYIDRNMLDRGLTTLKRTTYFDRATLRIDDMLGPDGEPLDGWKRAVYEVVEGSTGKFTFGVSLSTNGGIAAQVQFRKQNFDIARPATSWKDIESGRAWTGAGQEFNVTIMPSTDVSQFRVSFREPRFFGTKLAFDTGFHKNFEVRRTYVADRGGYTVGFAYPLWTNPDETMGLVGRVAWRQEWIDIVSVSVDAIPGAWLFNKEHELRGLSGSLSFGTVDDYVNPRHTTQTVLSAEIVGSFLGGDLNFYSLSGQHSQTFVVHEDEEGKKHRLVGRALIGLSKALDGTPEVPPYERFFAGGRSLRGFSYRGVGPHVNGYPIGGEWTVLANLEYEFPLVKKVLSVVAFVDSGTVATGINEPDAGLWRLAVGGGLRFAIPSLLGSRPLALDFGFPLMSEDEDEESVVSFSMGRNF